MAGLFYTHKQKILMLLAVVLVSAAFLMVKSVLAEDDPSFSLLGESGVEVNQTIEPVKDIIITVTSINGFNSAVDLSDNCAAFGDSCSWPNGSSCTPPANGSCTQILRFNGTNSTRNSRALTISGTSGNLRSNVYQWVTVNCGSTEGTYYERDFSDNMCSYGRGVTSGDSSSLCWNGGYKCCGDDDQEYLVSGNTDGIAWSSNSVSACLAEPGYTCVKDGEYYTEGITHNLNPGGNDNIAYCVYGGWKDCDTGYCEDYYYSGEVLPFGEYSNFDQYGYCGDDFGENLITLRCSGQIFNSPRCCDKPTDKIDYQDKCVESCPEAAEPVFYPFSSCVNMEDVNSPPDVLLIVNSYCSFSAESCVYKIYKNSVNNFNSSKIISNISINKVGGKYIGSAGGNFYPDCFGDADCLKDLETTPNTQYFYWIEEYDSGGNLVVRSDAISGYSGRTGKVTGLYSQFKYIAPYDAAILWQWDNYPGASDYSVTEIGNFNFGFCSEPTPYNPYYGNCDIEYQSDHFDFNLDTNKPYALFYNYEDYWGYGVGPYTEQSRTVIVRPNFDTQGTIACGPDAADETVNYPITFGPPSNLRHTSNTVSSITWIWNAASGSVTGYHVYDSNGVFLATVTGTSFTWNNLPFPNKQYGIKVRAFNATETSEFTEISYAYTSIESASQFSCAAASKTSLTVNVTNIISDPQPDDPHNDYEKKINFSLGGAYTGWQSSVSKSFASLTCGTNYTIGAKTRNGDNEETAPGSIICSTAPCVSGPDLIIQNIEALASVCRGDMVEVDATVKNIGDQIAGSECAYGAHKTKMYIDSVDGGQFMDDWTDILDPSESVVMSGTWNTAAVAVGAHNIIVVADAPNDSCVNEANENNNILEKSITVRDCSIPDGNNPPTAVNLLTPANNATGISVSPTFTWTEATDPDGDILTYHFYLAVCPGNDCSGIDPLSADPNGPDISAATSIATSSLLANTKYIWNVRATDGSEAVASANGPFVFITAETGVGGTPPTANFEWCKVSSDTAQFIDTSTPDANENPIVSWQWQFNDGTAVDTTQNPLHTFGDTPFQSPQFTWYGTLDDSSSITVPIPGPGEGGGVMGTTTFIDSPHGSAMLVDASGEGAYFPTSGGSFNKARGAIQFFFQPLYNSNTAGEPNHYFYRADGPSGDSWELKFQNNGFYYKIVDNDVGTGCILSATSINPGWIAGEWLKIVAMWDENEDKLRLYVYDGETDELRNSFSTNCTINFSSAITLGNMYVGNSWPNGGNHLKGAVDEFMVFNDDVYTLTGGTDNFTVTLTATDQENDSDSETKTVVLADAPDCEYLINDAAAYNCTTVGITWAHPTAWTPKSYDIYRSSSTGCATEPNNPSLCVWSLLKTQDKSVGGLYDDATVNQNTRYWYYLSANPIDQRNSTASCDGGLGVGTNICPVSTLVPICPMDLAELSSTHRCGSITLRWSQLSNAKAYIIAKSPSGTDNFSQLLKVDESNMETYCPDGENYCTYQDKEVVPVNVLTPTETQKYFYQISAQGEDDNWSATSTPIGDWSYCYRGKSWQER